MNIIICGAGQVGFNLAKYLAGRNHNITVIDQNQTLINKINDQLDAKGICGQASHPDILRNAGVETTDMIIALTAADEVNMVACHIAHALFHVPVKIARIRSQSYLDAATMGIFAQGALPIDYIISPEIEVAQAIARGLEIPGAFDITDLADGAASLIGMRCTSQTPIVNTPISHIASLFPEVDFTIVGIAREDEKFVPDPSEVLQAGDEVHFVVGHSMIEKALRTFGYQDETTKRMVILGGGNVGLLLAQEIEDHHPHIRVQIVERNEERAHFVAQQLSRTIVLRGDALESEMLAAAGVKTADLVVSLTEDDRVNTLASILAKRLGARKTLCLTNRSSFNSLVLSLGSDAVINPRVVTLSKIMQYIRKGRLHSVHSLGDDFGEVMDVDALHAPSLVGKTVQELFDEEKILVAGILREEVFMIPGQSTSVRPEDRVIIMLGAEEAKLSEQLLGID